MGVQPGFFPQNGMEQAWPPVQPVHPTAGIHLSKLGSIRPRPGSSAYPEPWVMDSSLVPVDIPGGSAPHKVGARFIQGTMQAVSFAPVGSRPRCKSSSPQAPVPITSAAETLGIARGTSVESIQMAQRSLTAGSGIVPLVPRGHTGTNGWGDPAIPGGGSLYFSPGWNPSMQVRIRGPVHSPSTRSHVSARSTPPPS